MTDGPVQDILAAIYAELQDHDREAGKKRDQVIAFYLLVLVALFGGWDKIAPIRDVVLGTVWAAGVISFVVVMHHRAWHITHGGAMVTLQRLMLEPEPLTLEHCRLLWERTNDTKIGFVLFLKLLNPLRGVESAMTWLFAILTMPPGFLLLESTGFAFKHVQSREKAFAYDLLAYTLVLVVVSTFSVMWKHKFQPNIWAFRWLRNLSWLDRVLQARGEAPLAEVPPQ